MTPSIHDTVHSVRAPRRTAPRFLRCAATPLLLTLSIGAAVAGVSGPTLLKIPGGAHGLGFDDLGFSHTLDRVLVPAAQTGNLVLVDPADDALQVLRGVAPAGGGDHDAGTTSSSYGMGLLFASDRPQQQLLAVDPKTGKVLARIALAGQPDYVRYVAPLHQVWVTEPHNKQIERFAVSAGATTPSLRRLGAVPVPHGPESLLIDTADGMAFTNQWQNHTLAIPLNDLHAMQVWPNTCRGSRGLALDAMRHTLFVGCAEGKVVALDLARHGAVIASAPTGKGVDIIAWNPRLDHLYVSAALSATLTVLSFDGRQLLPLQTLPAALHSHCVATDGRSMVYACDPGAGALLVYRDAAGGGGTAGR